MINETLLRIVQGNLQDKIEIYEKYLTEGDFDDIISYKCAVATLNAYKECIYLLEDANKKLRTDLDEE